MDRHGKLRLLLTGVVLLMQLGCERHPSAGKDASGNASTSSNTEIRALSKPAMDFKPKDFERIVEEHVSGKLSDKGGVIQLPREMQALTVDGGVYVTDSVQGRLYMFLSWRGKGSNLRGHIFFTKHNDGTIAPESIEVIGPVMSGVGETSGLVEVHLEDTPHAGWYKVARDLD